MLSHTTGLKFGESSRPKHGGAYFLAVSVSIKDLIAAPGLYENQEFQKLVDITPAPTLSIFNFRINQIFYGPSNGQEISSYEYGTSSCTRL